MPHCRIRTPSDRTPSPFFGTRNSHLSYKSVSTSYSGFYGSGIPSSDVYLDVRLADRDKICEVLRQTGYATVAASCTVDVDFFLGADTVFIVFITRPNMGTRARPVLCTRSTINCSPHDYTYGIYAVRLHFLTLSTAKFECSYNAVRDQL